MEYRNWPAYRTNKPVLICYAFKQQQQQQEKKKPIDLLGGRLSGFCFLVTQEGCRLLNLCFGTFPLSQRWNFQKTK